MFFQSYKIPQGHQELMIRCPKRCWGAPHPRAERAPSLADSAVSIALLPGQPPGGGHFKPSLSDPHEGTDRGRHGRAGLKKEASLGGGVARAGRLVRKEQVPPLRPDPEHLREDALDTGGGQGADDAGWPGFKSCPLASVSQGASFTPTPCAAALCSAAQDCRRHA